MASKSDVEMVSIGLAHERCVDIKEAWMRIKTEILEAQPQADNTGSPKLPCTKCGKDGLVICETCFGEVITSAVKQAWQLRADA